MWGRDVPGYYTLTHLIFIKPSQVGIINHFRYKLRNFPKFVLLRSRTRITTQVFPIHRAGKQESMQTFHAKRKRRVKNFFTTRMCSHISLGEKNNYF